MKRLFILVAIVLCAACSREMPRIPPLAPDAVILAFGDSITFGSGAQPGQSYPEILGTLVNRTVIGAGVPGEVTAEGRGRLPGALDQYKPALLILCHGGNDMLRRIGTKQAADNLRAMIAMARERGAAVVLVGVPQPGIFLSTAEFYDDVAKELRVPYDGDTLTAILKDRDLKADAIHPNARGYRMLAEAVAGLLKKSGAVP